jgi:anti-sigma factor RsiW
MAVNDNDIELLDSYLDGELPMSECEGLWRRLAVEPELAAELDRLRADAATRQIVYSSLEPADDILASLQRNILKSARKESLRATYNRYVRRFATIAACLLFGVSIGWWGNATYPTFAHGWLTPGGNSSMASAGNTLLGVAPVTSVPAAPHGKFIVNIRDGSGQVIATQQFNTYDEAKQFVDDYAKSQAGRSESHGSPVAPVGDKF